VFCFPLIKSKSPAGIIPSVLRYILFVFVIIYMSSCNIYSFTGASISPDIKTVSITNFSNNALIVNPLLSSILTEKLRDRFITTSNLSPVQKNGDLSFEGTIITYNTAPIAIQANETASQNRLTVVVSFSRFADYQSGLPFSSVEDELSRKVSEQLVDDIFNKAVVNW
jgi:hypothetical protein